MCYSCNLNVLNIYYSCTDENTLIVLGVSDTVRPTNFILIIYHNTVVHTLVFENKSTKH